MFGPCKTCQAHLAHINSLLAQIETLKKVAYPTIDRTLDVSAAEFTNIISGNDEPVTMPPTDEQLEAAAIITGTYE